MHCEKYKKLVWEKNEDRELLAHLLRQGEVVISSNDTIYGFLATLNQKSYNRIQELKKTKYRRPFLILVGSVEKIFDFVERKNVTDRIVKFLSLCWPGPVTVVFRAKEGISKFLVSENDTVALRVPNHSGMLSLLSEFDGLFSTSANRSGAIAPASLSQISYELLCEVRYVVVDSIEKVSDVPSTVVDFSGGELKIVRHGVYSEEKLREFYD